jgi:hypothetical protein
VTEILDDNPPDVLWFWQSTCRRGGSFHMTREIPEADPSWPRTCPIDGTLLAMIGAAPSS